ncbi:type II secretion system F family protein [Candidatus Saccharibacteria bacterium]|nr:type II secretion system F family protein [Candidatus Saccharibacteria bacterium]
MKRFSYRAKEQSTGKVLKGTIQAENERTAGKLLLDRGYIPESVKEEGTGFFSKAQSKVTAADRINFTRQFSTLIGAGLPVAQSLRTVAEQTEAKGMKAVIEQINADIEAGRSLGDAFGKHPDIFNNVYMSLIRAGEVSGTLDSSLRRIAEQEEKNENIMKKIKGAMMYPLISLGVILAVFIYMMLNVVPEVQNLYDSMGEELPALTTALVAIKDFIINFWYIVLIILGVGIFSLRQFSKTMPGIRMMANIKLNVPMFNNLFRLLYNGRFARISQILLSTGVSVLDSVHIAGESTDNVVVQEIIEDAATMVQGGKPLSTALKDRDYILPLVPNMAAIGEESGKMDEMLGKAAQVYEDELDEKVNAISTLIEPVMLLMLGGVAALLVAGVLLPIYSLVGSIK